MSKAEELARKYCEGSSFEDACMEKPAYIAGYHQAEKDLLENKHEKSWRLDKQLWAGIKDIDEASYQYIYDASNDWAYDVPTWDDVQDAFKAGSKWKERLELTWEDIRLIAEIGDKFMNSEESDNLSEEDYYKEVLKRFNKERKLKEQR